MHQLDQQCVQDILKAAAEHFGEDLVGEVLEDLPGDIEEEGYLQLHLAYADDGPVSQETLRGDDSYLLLDLWEGDYELERRRPPTHAAEHRRRPPGRGGPQREAQFERLVKEGHYARWPEAPVPALGGLSPRQAAKAGGAAREQLEVLLQELEHMEA